MNLEKQTKKNVFLCFTSILLVLTSTTTVLSEPTEPQTTPQPTLETDWWTMLRHDANNTASTTTPGPDTGQLLWKTTIPEPIASTAPIIANNHLYLNTNPPYYLNPPPNHSLLPPPPNPQKLLAALTTGYEGSIYCLDTATGTHLWHKTFVSPNTPVYLNDKLYFTDTNVYALSSNLNCLNANTGATIFNRPIAGGIAISPTITANGNLYFNAIDVYTFGGTVDCVDTNGHTKWTYNLPVYEWSFSPPTADATNVYIVTYNINSSYTGHLVCLNARTGASKWSKTIGNVFTYVNQPNIAVCSQGNVYVTDFNIQNYNTYLRCYNGNTGATQWTHTLLQSLSFSPPAISNNSLYVTYGNLVTNQTFLLKLYASNGTQQWITTQPNYAPLGNVYCTANKVLVTATSDYTYSYGIYTYDKNTGELLWYHIPTLEMAGTPAIANNTLYLTDYKGGIYAHTDQLTLTRFHLSLLTAGLTLTNTGNNTFTNITWRLTATGGFLNTINNTRNGTIATLPPHLRTNINTGLLIGFGPFTLNATIAPQGSPTFIKHAKGFALGPLILITLH